MREARGISFAIQILNFELSSQIGSFEVFGRMFGGIQKERKKKETGFITGSRESFLLVKLEEENTYLKP